MMEENNLEKTSVKAPSYKEAVITRIASLTSKMRSRFSFAVESITNISDTSERKNLTEKTSAIHERLLSKLSLAKSATLFALALSSAGAFAEEVGKVKSPDMPTVEAKAAANQTSLQELAQQGEELVTTVVLTVKELGETAVLSEVSKEEKSITTLTNSNATLEQRIDSGFDLTKVQGVKQLIGKVGVVGKLDTLNTLQKRLRGSQEEASDEGKKPTSEEGEKMEETKAHKPIGGDDLKLAVSLSPNLAAKLNPIFRIAEELSALQKAYKGGTLTPLAFIISVAKLTLDAHTAGLGSYIVTYIANNNTGPADNDLKN